VLVDLALVATTTCVGLPPNVVELIQVSKADCKVLMFCFKIIQQGWLHKLKQNEEEWVVEQA